MRHRLLKSLRIAVTAVSLLVCGLLIVLWVRSYDYYETMGYKISGSHVFGAVSSSGFFYFFLTDLPYGKWTGEWVTFPPAQRRRQWSFYETSIDSRHGWSTTHLEAPHWVWLTIFATIATLPWIKWRFSLRTLLIVMTLFALFFGAMALSL